MIVISQDGESITNCFSFTIADNHNEYGYSIIDKISGIKYAKYESYFQCVDELARLASHPSATNFKFKK